MCLLMVIFGSTNAHTSAGLSTEFSFRRKELRQYTSVQLVRLHFEKGHSPLFLNVVDIRHVVRHAAEGNMPRASLSSATDVSCSHRKSPFIRRSCESQQSAAYELHNERIYALCEQYSAACLKYSF